MTHVLIEAFGSIVNEDLRSDEVSLADALENGLGRLSDFVDFSEVEKIYTGMNKDVTYALEDAVESMALDAEVNAFYPNVSNIAEEDDIEYNEAWKKGFTWRNNQLFVEDASDDERDHVSAAVRIGDAGNNGQALLQHARQKQVVAIDINLDDLIDRDAAYGGSEEADEGTVPDGAEAGAA